MIDTAALREKVLDLAIRGKLVPQDPTDEPASVLLERIHEQKLQMVREGKLKAKDVKDDTIIFKGDDNCYYEKFSDGTIKNIQDEIPFDLPDGWSWSKISSIAFVTKLAGFEYTKYIANNLCNDGIPLFKGKNVQDGKIIYEFESYIPLDISNELSRSQITRKCLLTPYVGTIGNIGIHSKEGIFHLGSNVGKIELYNQSEVLLEEYVVAYMKSTYGYKELTKHIKATAQASISIDAIRDVYIAIPPSNEQKRIAQKVDEILSFVAIIDNLRIEIDDIQALLKSRILELAIQGKLVPQDENDEPAGVLLERIRAERKAKLGKKYVESYIYKGDDNCYYEKVGSTVKNITDQIPFSIPQNWSFVRLKELAKVVSGVSYDKRDICNDGIRIIRGGNISNLSIVLLPDDVFLPQKYYDNEKEVKTEDIVIVASTGSKIAIGRPAFADKSFPQTQIGAFLRIVRPYVPNVYQYLKCLFASNYYREHISDLVHGNTINNIKTEYLDEFIIPFPPIREQKEIANKVKILMDILKGGD